MLSPANGLEIHNSSNVSDFIGVATPQFSDLDSTKRIKFYVYDEDGSFDGSDLYIGTMSDRSDPATFTAYDTITAAEMDDDAWEFFVVSFANYTGTDEYIAFQHGQNSTFDNIHIDDFSYEPIPQCQPPLITSMGAVNVTSSAADLFWGSGSDGQKTYVEVGPTGFTPGSGNQVVLDSVAGSVDTISSGTLSPQTTYEFYIRDSCATDGLSPWKGPISFTTTCIASTLPYLEDFSSYTAFPTCWTRSHPTDVTFEASCAPNSNVIQIRYTENAVSPRY
ncbi:MAG: choice-of-anchor J domain-containing protein [Owenweeksia sp.]|nr:choice-of-anchor J domain-containing protein [Owenweeksia sp.]